MLIVGTGLIGTSIALALRRHGVGVALADHDPDAVRAARRRGAGQAWRPGSPVDLAVVAVPPEHVAAQIHHLQRVGAARAYTDVASVKQAVIGAAGRLGCDMSTYIPSHPMAGRERRGPDAAAEDLFRGRPWALCPLPQAAAPARAAVLDLIGLCGAHPVELPAADHDQAVACVSHAPHVASSAVAARLAEAPAQALALAGTGVRDVTRVAGGDPALWLDILTANAAPVAEVLEAMAADLAATASALRGLPAGDRAAAETVAALLRRGAAGRHRIAQAGREGA
ncbi:prephenate dehydrogenase [Bailinhaonella thermotolerans]|uniref:prephenate dehydrogenase n=1 Tax=Bailinhaonella thermotolerans TaxID=1070861 RepID=UPI0030ED8356